MKEKLEIIENGLNWDTKTSKAVWRGSVHWNSGLRGKLVEVAKGKAWSDVQQLDWKNNALTMEEFCKYKYLIYTEVRDLHTAGHEASAGHGANSRVRGSLTPADYDTSNSAALSSSLHLYNGEPTSLLSYKQKDPNKTSSWSKKIGQIWTRSSKIWRQIPSRLSVLRTIPSRHLETGI